MSIEKATSLVVVGFDGLHRAGKGTQATMLKTAIGRAGGRSIILRGDGTRDGLGLSEGDLYSEEWQARSRHVKSPEGNTIENWNAASYLLMKELSEARNSSDGVDALIVDRTALSRVAFMLHRGIALEGARLSLDDMYPDNAQAGHEALDLASVLPDIIFELRSPTPVELLERLEDEDPKYSFRARNIRGGFNSASIAKQHLPVDVERRIVTIDAIQDTDIIHEKVKKELAQTALKKFFHPDITTV